jgi:ABC-type glycerol-3-phosphate transport system permease component
LDGIFIVIIISFFMLCFFAATTILLVRFTRKNSVIVHIFNPDKSERRKQFKNVISNTLDIDGRVYVYDDECTTRTWIYKHIYYMKDNPNPINFHSNIKNPGPSFKIKNDDIHTILKSDLISKLFSEDSIQKALLVLSIISLVAIIISIVVGAMGGNPPVELSSTGNNTAIIKQACISAIKGL